MLLEWRGRILLPYVYCLFWMPSVTLFFPSPSFFANKSKCDFFLFPTHIVVTKFQRIPPFFPAIMEYPDAELIELYHSPCLKRIYCTLDISTLSFSDLHVSSNFVNEFIPFLRHDNYLSLVTELNLSILIPPEMFWLTDDEPVKVGKQNSYLTSVIGSITNFPNLKDLNLSLYFSDEIVPSRLVPTPCDSLHEDTEDCTGDDDESGNDESVSLRNNPTPVITAYHHFPFYIGNLCHNCLRHVRLGFPSSDSVAFVFNVVHVPRCYKFVTNLLPPCAFRKCRSNGYTIPCCMRFNDQYIVGGLEYSMAYANGFGVQRMLQDFQYPHTRGLFKVDHGYFKQFTSNTIAIHEIVVKCGSFPFNLLDVSRGGMVCGWEVPIIDD